MPPHFKLKDTEYSQKYFAKYMREYRKKNPQYVKKDSDKRRDFRIKLLDILGGAKCPHCGFDKDIRVLQIDHKDNEGAKDARSFGSSSQMYRYYVHNPEIAKTKLQVLCANCNIIKQHNEKTWKSPTKGKKRKKGIW